MVASLDDISIALVGLIGVIIGAFISPMVQLWYDFERRPIIVMTPLVLNDNRKSDGAATFGIKFTNNGKLPATGCSIRLIAKDMNGSHIFDSRAWLKSLQRGSEGTIYPDSHEDISVMKIILEMYQMNSVRGNYIAFFPEMIWSSDDLINSDKIGFPVEIVLIFNCMETKKIHANLVIESQDSDIKLT